MIFCSIRVKRTSIQSCQKLADMLLLERVKQFVVINTDNDGNEIEVKFMYPSGNKRNKFSFGNADPV